MKKTIFSTICLIFLILTLVGCFKKQEENVSIELWHYYNGVHKIAFDQLVMEFNESIGLEKGIIVEAFSQGDIGHLETKVMDSLDQKVGASEPPNILTAYPEAAYTLDQRGALANLEDYLTSKEIGQYVDSYIEEGRLGASNKLKIFPTAKATEIMMINKTDWDLFAAATGAKIHQLAAWEGVREIAELYYNWTDSLSEEENDGKAFFGRDALANYMLVGAKQLGKELFKLESGKVTLEIDQAIMRKLWDHYYIPYISGYYTSYGRFSTDDAKIGEIIALVGSTTGEVFFPDKVTIGNNESYPIELLVLPLPNFKNTKASAIQQGAGMVVLDSDKAHEQAAIEFLKWFTENSRNQEFAIKTGYLPVKKEAYNIKKVKDDSISLAMEQVERYDLYINQPFENAGEARKILEITLENKAKADREQVKELISQGVSHKEAVAKFSSDESFDQWLMIFKKDLKEVVYQ